MIRLRFSLPFLAVVACLSLAFTGLSSCGDGGTGMLAGGGTGGTGISTGPITGFGSVIMDGATFRTDDEVAPGFMTKKNSKGMDHSNLKDKDLFRIGMIVTVYHGATDNDATEIDYEPRLLGPILSKTPGPAPVIEVLGQTVIVGDASLFASLDVGNVAEVSGFVDDQGRIRATYVEVTGPAPVPGEAFEIKGYVLAPDPSAGTFALGPLPDGAGSTLTVSYAPGAIHGLPPGPPEGTYVQVVTTDTEPVNGVLAAIAVHPSVPRTSFPENATVDLDGLVTKTGGTSGNVLSFTLEDKEVRTSDATAFVGGSATDLVPNARVQAHGKETGGIVSADRILFR